MLFRSKDKVEVFAKAGYEYRTGEDIFGWEDEEVFIPTYIGYGKGYAFYGGGVNYYPLRNSKDLRLHAVVGANTHSRSVAINVGATYHFNLTDLIQRQKEKRKANNE